MNGVVTLLDGEQEQQVRALWANLEREFGLRGAGITPYPHFSYQVAEEYELQKLVPILERIALDSAPFHVRAGGLGVFTSAWPVLYLPVVRSPELTRFHHRIWHEVSRAATGIVAYYQVDRWLPHVTLAERDLDRERLPDVVRWLTEHAVDLDIAVDNIALIYDSGISQELHLKLHLGG